MGPMIEGYKENIDELINGIYPPVIQESLGGQA